MESNTLWRVINKYFEENPQYLVAHHLESYNDFFQKNLFEIFKNQNPIQITSAFDDKIGDFKHKCNLYIGGRTGRRVYLGKPMIHDAENGNARAHYMYPNEARIRGMTYGMTVHYDVEVEFIDILEQGEAPYVVGPEFLDEEELAKLGQVGGQAMADEDIDYSAAFQQEANATQHNYKVDGGEGILQKMLQESQDPDGPHMDGGARKAKDAPLQGDKEGNGKVETKKKREKQQEAERRQVKLTTAMAAATKEVQVRSVSHSVQSHSDQKRHVLLKTLY
jgi:hypothetical protein